MGHILRSARLRWLGHWGLRLIDNLNFWFLGHWRELDSILLQGRVNIVEKWQLIPLFFFKSYSPLLDQIHNFLKNLQKYPTGLWFKASHIPQAAWSYCWGSQRAPAWSPYCQHWRGKMLRTYPWACQANPVPKTSLLPRWLADASESGTLLSCLWAKMITKQ